MNYLDAVLLRIQAEQTADPNAYMRAALAFQSLDMPSACSSMLDRAAHYQAIVQKNNLPDPQPEAA